MSVVSLDEERQARQPHISGPALCLGCRHKWISVTPVGHVENLECPSCHLMKGVLVELPQHGEEVWTCGCGNDLFRISPEAGPYCAKCAKLPPAEMWGAP